MDIRRVSTPGSSSSMDPLPTYLLFREITSQDNPYCSIKLLIFFLLESYYDIFIYLFWIFPNVRRIQTLFFLKKKYSKSKFLLPSPKFLNWQEIQFMVRYKTQKTSWPAIVRECLTNFFYSNHYDQQALQLSIIPQISLGRR